MKQYSADITAAAHATMQAINNASGPNSQFEAVADAILAERERCVEVAGSWAGDLRNGDKSRFTAAHIAAAIRSTPKGGA